MEPLTTRKGEDRDGDWRPRASEKTTPDHEPRENSSPTGMTCRQERVTEGVNSTQLCPACRLCRHEYQEEDLLRRLDRLLSHDRPLLSPRDETSGTDPAAWRVDSIRVPSSAFKQLPTEFHARNSEETLWQRVPMIDSGLIRLTESSKQCRVDGLRWTRWKLETPQRLWPPAPDGLLSPPGQKRRTDTSAQQKSFLRATDERTFARRASAKRLCQIYRERTSSA
ncbi:hypothetical protein GN956_G19269 [Arapaima gigas]